MAKMGGKPSTKPETGMGGGKPAAVSKPPQGAGQDGRRQASLRRQTRLLS